MPSDVMFYLNGGGLFTVQGRWWDGQVEAVLGELGAGVYNPWRESKEEQLRATTSAEESRRLIFESDRNGVDVSQGVIMLGEGSGGEVSSGTAWETGYAYARNKHILCVRTDFRGTINPTLEQCLMDGKVCGSLEELGKLVRAAMERIRGSKLTRTSYEGVRVRRDVRKVFLSATHFSEAEETFAKGLRHKLSRLGYDVIFPAGDTDVRRGLLSSGQRARRRLFDEKTEGLNECDALVALLEGADCDTETSWDCGYGYSKYKPVYGMRTDFRSQGDLAGVINLMIEQSIVDTRLCTSVDEVSRLIRARR